jgi:hypothetical protein
VPVFGIEPPAQARPRLINAERILEILATQMNGTADGLRHGVGGVGNASHLPAAADGGKGLTMAVENQIVEFSVRCWGFLNERLTTVGPENRGGLDY